MRKGRFGIVYSFYVILAFIGVILKLPILCALVLGFVLLAEKDEWTGRQTLQALLLSLVVTFFGSVMTWAVSLLSFFYFYQVLNVIVSVVSVLVYAAAIVFSILGILKAMKDQEADLPLVSDIAYRAYGKVKPKPVPPQYSPPYGQGVPQPGQQTPPQYHVPPVPPAQPPYGAPQSVQQPYDPAAGAPQNGGAGPQNPGPQPGGPQNGSPWQP